MFLLPSSLCFWGAWGWETRWKIVCDQINEWLWPNTDGATFIEEALYFKSEMEIHYPKTNHSFHVAGSGQREVGFARWGCVRWGLRAPHDQYGGREGPSETVKTGKWVKGLVLQVGGLRWASKLTCKKILYL
jgi:hypothetical protein